MDDTANVDVAVFRVYGSAMEPCFRDGEFLQVTPGLGTSCCYGTEIVVRYDNGKHELVEYFGCPSDEVDVVGHVTRRVRVVGTNQPVRRIDASTDTRWRERRSITRTLFRVHGVPRDVGPLSPQEQQRRAARDDGHLGLFVARMDAVVRVMPQREDEPDDTLMTAPPPLPKRRRVSAASADFVGPKRPRGRPRKATSRP